MKNFPNAVWFSALIGAVLFCNIAAAQNEEAPSKPRAFLDGSEPGWRTLGADDFENVNCDPDTWRWEGDEAHCKGTPIGVMRSKEVFTNFELMVEWKHLKPAGNSGVFVWSPRESLDALEPGQLPQGIEIQILDNAYADQYEQRTGKKPDWFTTHGDVFPTGASKMTPFPPTSPNGSRSFPSQQLSRSAGQWNHYYIRCINGEVRLWVNGQEVSGGTGCDPSTGHLALESEGSPIIFRNLCIRELP